MGEPTNDTPKIVAHLLDMDSADKKLIPIPDMTLVKMKDIFFFFVGGRIYHTREGFDMFPHGEHIMISYDSAEFVRSALLQQEMSKSGYMAELEFDNTIYEEFHIPRGNK